MKPELLLHHPLAPWVIAGATCLVIVGFLLRWRRRGGNSAHYRVVQRVGTIHTVRRGEGTQLVALRIEVDVIAAGRGGDRLVQISVVRNGALATLDRASPDSALSLAARLRKAGSRCGVQ